MIGQLRASVSTDTLRNEYLMHNRVHSWFAGGQVTGGFAELNSRVYRDLFLTPEADPWLGLVRGTTYTGLVGGGIVGAVQ